MISLRKLLTMMESDGNAVRINNWDHPMSFAYRLGNTDEIEYIIAESDERYYEILAVASVNDDGTIYATVSPKHGYVDDTISIQIFSLLNKKDFDAVL